MKLLFSILLTSAAIVMLPNCNRDRAMGATQSPPAKLSPAAPAGVKTLAKEWLHRLQTGDVDRSQLSDQLKLQLTPTILHQMTSFLKPLGDPSDFIFSGSQRVQGGTVYKFLLTFKPGRLDETFALDPRGKIAGLYFRPRVEATGADVEVGINERLAPFVQSQSAQLSIGRASCPPYIDLMHGPGHCTLTVDGVALPIHVLRHGNGWIANFDGGIYLRAETEAFAEKHLLSMYGVTAIAHCEGPPITIRPPGTEIRCTLTGLTEPATILLRTPVKGMGDSLYVYPPAGLSNTLPFTDTAVRAHQRKESVLLTDGQLNAFLDRWVTTETMRGNIQVGKARCPISNDFTGANSVACTIPFDNQDAHYKVWIDDEQGFQVSQLDAIIPSEKLLQFAEQQISLSIQHDGSSPQVTLDCGFQQRLIVTPAPGIFSCKVLAGAAKGTVRVVIEHSDGTFHLDNLKMDKGIRAAPPSP